MLLNLRDHTAELQWQVLRMAALQRISLATAKELTGAAELWRTCVALAEQKNDIDIITIAREQLRLAETTAAQAAKAAGDVRVGLEPFTRSVGDALSTFHSRRSEYEATGGNVSDINLPDRDVERERAKMSFSIAWDPELLPPSQAEAFIQKLR